MENPTITSWSLSQGFSRADLSLGGFQRSVQVRLYLQTDMACFLVVALAQSIMSRAEIWRQTVITGLQNPWKALYVQCHA